MTTRNIRPHHSWGERVAEWAGRKAADAKYRKDVMACRVMGHEPPNREQGGIDYGSIWLCGRCGNDVRT